MFRTLFVAALVSLPAIASAQASADPAPVPQRVRSITLTGDQKCPKGAADEIIVCSKQEDPYRIPKQLRQLAPSATNNSWVNRAAVMDDVSRRAGGLPDTCSPVGTGGQSGCSLQQNNAYAADRRAQKAEADSIP